MLNLSQPKAVPLHLNGQIQKGHTFGKRVLVQKQDQEMLLLRNFPDHMPKQDCQEDARKLVFTLLERLGENEIQNCTI